MAYARRRRARAIPGGSFLSVMKKIGDFLKKTKLVSTVGHSLAPVIPIAGTIGSAAAKLGYGRRPRRRRVRAGALSLPGGVMVMHHKKKHHRRAMHPGMGALSLAGGRMQRSRVMRIQYY